MKRTVLFSALVSLLAACTRPEPPTAIAGPATSAMASPVASGESIYVLHTSLVDQDGARVPIDVYRGHPVLMAMFYGTCPAACPTLTSDLVGIEARLTPEQRADVRVLMVSFDPDRDGPKKLQDLMTKHKMNRERWKLATSSEASVREVAAVLGVQYRKIEGGEYAHSTKIVLLDRDGAIAAQLEGLQQPPDALVAKLQSLPNAE